MTGLWDANSPERFWMCEPPASPEEWAEAVRCAAPVLGLPEAGAPEELPGLTLGEGRFGPDHWTLTRKIRLYYLLKPLLPRKLIQALRRVYNGGRHESAAANWPVDPRYASFLWNVLAELAKAQGRDVIRYRALWPEGRRFALILTHDIETARGQAVARRLADLEESLGFRSSFNFALRQYPLDLKLMDELRARGFEVGCHGLRHDGRLFLSEQGFAASAAYINGRMHELGMAGFRSPLTLRHPQWMQRLEIEYDSSFFDTDPFEPIPGGAMSIWPFFLGRFVELPYTLVQDYALAAIVQARGAHIWLEKLDYIRSQQGMALLNVHPDYIEPLGTFDLYTELLRAAREMQDCWHAVPREAAAWWRRRADPAYDAPMEQYRVTA